MRQHNVFSKEIPLDVLWTFLEDVCAPQENYYFIDKNMFAKMIFERRHISFLNCLKSYYFKSKHHYLADDITYNSFVTVLRQICNYHKQKYLIRKVYNHSNYTMCYFIERPL